MEQDETDCNFIGNPKNAKFRFESFHNTKIIGFLLRIIAKQKVSKISFQRNRKRRKIPFRINSLNKRNRNFVTNHCETKSKRKNSPLEKM
jgi:hypothetical protein